MPKKSKILAGALMLVVLIYPHTSKSQKAIELAFVGRYDQHADYVSNFAGRVYDDYHKLYGTSYGVSINYRQAVSKHISSYIGLGYYQLNIDKIRGPIAFNIPGTRTARSINYEDAVTNLGYSTSEYRYNNLAMTIGGAYLVPVEKTTAIEAGAELVSYFSFSQRYRLYGTQYWHTSHRKPIEFGFNVTLGIYKEYPTFYIRPSLLVPIFQNLKGDVVFYEDRDLNIPKWFSGFGLKLAVGRRIGHAMR